MDLTDFRLLHSPLGQQCLLAAEALAPREVDFLSHFSHLSRLYPPELARAALETAILRREGADKFPHAAQMYFTRPALEQASSYEVSSYRAGRYAACERLLDLGCSIGGDTLALAGQAPVLGLDLDPLRLSMARANLDALKPAHPVWFAQADLSQPLPVCLSSQAGLFFDPSRRSQGRRIFSVHRYLPALENIQNWLPKAPSLGVKLSPGVDLSELQGYDAEIEFISLRGELKEAVLWFGPLKSAPRRATVLPGPHRLAADPDQPHNQAGLLLSEPRAFLYEPDPAILRAGLVRSLASQLSAAQLDPDIAYLTSDQLSDSPFAEAFRVEDWLPFNLKRLRAILRQRGVGRVVVKKRGSPIQPEALIHALRLPDPDQALEARIIFLTHLRGKPIAILCYASTEKTVNSPFRG